jgi:hypothetical protein
MRKILAVVAAAGITLALAAGSANAVRLTNKKVVGWYDFNAPIGGGYWFNENVGIQAGFGFNKVNLPDPAEDPDVSVAFTAAVPIRIAGPETAHFYFRPGFFYETNPAPGDDSFLSIRADLVVEYYLSHHFSIVGGHGVEYISISPDVGDAVTVFQARPISAASVGFFYYFGNED